MSAEHGLGLAGMRVVECGQGVSAAYAAKLLADVGADVVKVEPPDGDLTRRRGPFPDDERHVDTSGLFTYLNTNKRGVTADLATADGQARLHRLLADADVLIHNVPPPERPAMGLDSRELCAAHPALVVTSMSIFGDAGPRSAWRGYELTVSNAGGWAFVSPGASPYPDLPPLKPFGAQCDFHTGAYGAITSVAAARYARRSGRGQAIDIAAQETIVAMLENNLVHWTYTGRETSRLGSRVVGPWFIADCADGKIFVMTVEEDQWDRLVELMGHPDWATDEIFQDRLARAENLDALKLLMSEWLNSWKVQDLYRQAQQHRIPFAPVNTMQQLYESEHLRARGFFVSLDQPGLGRLHLPGAPSQYSTIRWALRRPAPRLGEHTGELDSEPVRTVPASRRIDALDASAGPLTGIRVLDFTAAWAGPFATQLLAHLGAEVIRVEATTRTPCVTRLIPPFADDQPGPGRAGYFNQYNQGKRSIMLDLRRPEGLAVAHQLVEHSDVVADNFSAGVMTKLGLDYETLRRLKPDIIQISMSGYGQTGPFRAYLGYGPPAGALAGLFGLTGYRGGDPAEIGLSYPDPNAGLMGAYAVLVALAHRDVTGEGQYIDQSQWEAVLVHMAEGLLEWDINGREPRRAGNHDRQMSPHETYKARGGDDAWVSIAVGSDEEWAALCLAIGRPELAADPRFATAELRKEHEEALDQILEAWTTTCDRWEITELLQGAGVAAFPSMSNRDLVEDPHLNARRFFVELDHPAVGRRIHAGIPWTMSDTPCRVRATAPMPGADTDDVLAVILGLASTDIEHLRAAEVIR